MARHMKVHEFVAIGLRVFAIALFLFALNQFVTVALLASSISEDIPRGVIFLGIATVVVPVVVAILIWRFPLTVAKTIVPTPSNQSLDALDKNDLFVGATIILGLYVLAFGLVDLIYWITRFKIISDVNTQGLSSADNLETTANFYATLVEIGIGVWLILGSGYILRIIRKVRDWS